MGQCLFRLNQIVCIDQPQLNIPWFNDRFALEVVVPGKHLISLEPAKDDSFDILDMRRHWQTRHTVFDHVESNLTTILGGREYLQKLTVSPYFHEIGREVVGVIIEIPIEVLFRFRMYPTTG